MAITITGTLIVDETLGTQNATAGGSDITGNDVIAGLGDISTGVSAFDTLLDAVVVQDLTGVNVTVAVSNGTSADPDGSPMLSGFGSNVTDLAFTNSSGGPLLGEMALSAPGVPLLTVDGTKIFLYSYTGADLGIDENNVVFGRKANADGSANPNGDIVFAAYLQPTDAAGNVLTSDLNAVGAKVWLVQYEEIQHPITTNPDDALSLYNLNVTVSNRSDFSLEGAPSGQNLFLMYGDGTPSLTDAVIIATGKNPINQSDPNAPAITSGDTVNTGQGGGPTTLGTNSQQIVEGTGLYFTFAQGANPNFTVPNLDQNEADVEANIDFTSLYGTNGASFSVVQSASGDKSTLEISAFSAVLNNQGTADTSDDTPYSGVDFVDNLHNNDPVEVIKVTITTQPSGHGKNAVPGETLVFDKSIIQTTPTTLSGITVTFFDNSVVIKGLEADDLIAYNTDGPHNRVLIDNIGSTDTNFDAPFDIGGFALVNSNATPNQFSALTFHDDGPSVTVSATNESAILLTTQDAETDGDPTAQDSAATTADFSGVFSNLPAYGTDGAGTTVMSYALSLYGPDGSDSLLDSNGVQINLYNVSGLIVGSTSLSAAGITTGNTIFSIGVVPSGANAGIVTLIQYAEIDHALENPTTAPFDDQFAVLTNNLVKLTGTALSTDGDGDTATDSEDVDLGGNVRFADDGPSVTVSATNESAILLTTQDAETDGDPTAQDSAATTADFSGVFSNLPVYGADGAGTTVKSYALSLYGPDGSDSLLDSNGVQINLYNVSGLIVGSTSLSAAGITTGNTIFSIGVVPSGANAGIVTLIQYAEIDHALENPTTAPFDDQFAVLANNLVKLTGTALSTDGDGDTATDSEDVDLGGNVRFADDGPSVTVSATNESAILLTTQDAETDGDPTAQDSAATTADFSGVFSNLPVYGADGAGTTVKSYALSLYGPDGSDSLLDSNGVQINLYNVSGLIVGSTSLSAAGITTGNTIFSIGVVPSGANAGIVTLTQYAEIDHALENPTTAPFDDQFAVLANNLVKLTGTALSTDGDGDTATDSEDVDLGGNVRFADDGPAVSANATVLLDDDALTGGNPGGTGDDADSANVNGILGHDFGADGAGTVAYLTSGAPTGFSYVTDGTSLLVKQNQNGVLTTVLTLTMVPGTGAYTVAQNNPILHAAGLNENNQAFTISYRVTDGDGDTADGTLSINVDDDTPVMTAKSNLVYANTSNEPPVSDVGGTGVFAYSIGADKHVAPYSDPAGLTPNSDFLSVALTGVTVGTNNITNRSVTWASEDVSQAVFDVGFTYVSNPTTGATTNATGTLTFNKVAGTYTLKLDQEIASFSILNTSTPGNPLQGYALNSATTVGSNPPVSVMTLASNFFVQFEGFGVINGTPQTFAYDSVTGLFSNDRRYVTVSSNSIGAASDTLQSDEVIDLDFFTQNPEGFTGALATAPRATSKAIFIEFTQAGPGAGKDMVVVLKLVDDDDPTNTTTRTFIVGNSTGNDDVFNANLPAYGFVAKAQNGIVVFESNDYNFELSEGVFENYSIQGAQVVTSTQGVSGTGYQLNGAIDDPTTQASEGATTNAQIAFGGATTEGNNEPIKIVNIGFVASTTPDAHLTFDVVLTDADGDATAKQTLDVTIVGDNGVTASANKDTFVIGDTDVDGLLSMVMTVIDGGFVSGDDKLDFTTAGSETNYMEELTVAANLAAFTAAADDALNGTTQYYFGVVGSDGYLALDVDGAGITNIIQLVGVTNMASTDIV